jgi:glycosyltransferase involved in cell wall biosynthesis
MEVEKSCLLIHHHHIAYEDDNGRIWLSSVIGRWVESISYCVREVRLLLYQSEKHLTQQDTPIYRDNVQLYSLGTRRRALDSFLHLTHLRRACIEAGKEADGLLIRGITPHQSFIWRSTPVDHKAYLLVGSIKRENKSFPHSPLDAFLLFLGNLRLKELHQIANDGALMLTNSPQLVSEIGEVLGKKAYFVPTNSYRQGEFAPLQARPVSTPRRLLFCGRLDYKKGIRELMQALAILNQQGQTYHLDIVGAKLDPVYSELVELGKTLGISDLIDWHGFIPYGPELFSFYQQADALVLPSYSEGFPHVIWEAAANCCPVITTSVGGIPALLTHEVHCLLIPPKDVDAIVASINRLLSENHLRENIVRQAYDHAKAFTVEACAEKLTNVLGKEWK